MSEFRILALLLVFVVVAGYWAILTEYCRPEQTTPPSARPKKRATPKKTNTKKKRTKKGNT